jgi:hypothetical protein
MDTADLTPRVGRMAKGFLPYTIDQPDPESRILPDGANKGSFVQGYNAQIAVVAEEDARDGVKRRRDGTVPRDVARRVFGRTDEPRGSRAAGELEGSGCAPLDQDPARRSGAGFLPDELLVQRRRGSHNLTHLLAKRNHRSRWSRAHRRRCTGRVLSGEDRP